jgi:hypothetical protein
MAKQSIYLQVRIDKDLKSKFAETVGERNMSATILKMIRKITKSKQPA